MFIPAMINRFLKDTFWGRLDYLIVDTPPGTSEEHLTIASALTDMRPDGCIIVTTSQDVALDTIRKEISFCSKLKLPILGIVENMAGFACPCCEEISDIWGKQEEENVKQIADDNNIPFLGKIPLDPTLTHCAENGECVFCSARDKLPAGAIAVKNIVTKLCKK
jgi:Mrp family chromosome partitioning ATPase